MLGVRAIVRFSNFNPLPFEKMSGLECIIATGAAVAHGWFVYNGYQSIASGADDSSTVSWLAPVALPCAYLTVVFGGNALMAGRKPFSCKASMAIYNVYATCLSAVMLVLLGAQLVKGLPSMWTQPWDTPNASAAIKAAVWLNYQSKYVEYFDTFFMVLRAKREQVTALHVIHHAEMGPLMYFWAREATLNTAFGPALNSFIHTLMYAYYGLTGMGVRMPVVWKMVMTSSQMLQFVIIMGHSLFHMAHWNVYWSGHLAVIELLLMVQVSVRSHAHDGTH